MVAFPSWLRPCAAVVLVAGLLGLGSGCKRGSSGPAGTISATGFVTYTRTPIQYDQVTGQPLGYLPAQVFPARGVLVRAFQLSYSVDYTGALVPTWGLAGSAVTDINGQYSISGQVLSGYGTFLEVDSTFVLTTGNQSTVNVIADPAGIRSTVPAPHRPIYAYRLDAAGSLVTDAQLTTSQASVAVANGNFSLDFSLGASDGWAVTVPDWYKPGAVPYPGQTDPRLSVVTPYPAIGSRALAILDSVYYYAYWYGDPTPSQTRNGVLDLHYYPNITDPSRRSFVVYDPSMFYDAANDVNYSFDGTKYHYFGTLAAGPGADDAMDPGVIYPLLARNGLYGQGRITLFPYGQATPAGLLPSLAPDLAVVEGLADTMAANVLQSPWLTDITAAAGLVGRNISVAPAQKNAYSPGDLAAAGWAVTLRANGVAAPGTPAQWSVIVPSSMSVFFGLIYPYNIIRSDVGLVSVQLDVVNIYGQLSRLQENHPELPVNLSVLFPDQALLQLMIPYGIVWPGRANLPSFAVDWGVNPDSSLQALPSLTLSMADAQQVTNPDILHATPQTANVYLNTSQGEVVYAKLALNLARSYNFSITPSGALPAGAQIEVVVDGNYLEPYLFSTGQPASPYSLNLPGNPIDPLNPALHWFRIRVLSATVQQPDITLTVNLVRTS
jgi:hypothetical protein